jgi:tryptophan synthase beta subunit
MGKINLEVDDLLEREFRNAAVKKFEARKGFLKKAIEEAMSDWVKNNKRGGKNV